MAGSGVELWPKQLHKTIINDCQLRNHRSFAYFCLQKWVGRQPLQVANEKATVAKTLWIKKGPSTLRLGPIGDCSSDDLRAALSSARLARSRTSPDVPRRPILRPLTKLVPMNLPAQNSKTVSTEN